MRNSCVLLLYVAALACGGGAPSASPLVVGAPVAHLDSSAWRNDLRFLANELASRHRNAFFKTSRESFFAEAARIDSAIPRLDDVAVVYRLKRLVAMLGDGHTGGPSSIPGERRLPIRFEWFSDGIAVTGAGAAHASLVGRRIVRVGNVPIGTAFDTLARYDAADNEWGARSRVPRYLSVATALAAGRLVSAGDSTRMTFSARPGAGDRDTVVAFPWPDVSPVTLASAPAAPPPRPFSWRFEAGRNAVVIRYDRCDRAPEFASMADTILRFIDSAKVKRVVVDVRTNPGGNSAVAQPLIRGLVDRSSVLPGSAIYVLIGRGTYSSAMMFAIEMRQRVHAVLAGEPTGGTPNGYGEVKQLVLPNSRLVFQYSTKYFGLGPNGANAVQPDVHVGTTVDAFLARRDLTMETVLSR